MTRPLRYVEPGHSVHIIRRGVNRCQICVDDIDRHTLLAIIRDAAARFATDFHGFVLMDTHWHALATPVDARSLSATMKIVGQNYVRYFNAKYDRIGTLWTNRFTGLDVDTERYWLTCLRYIEQNPVRASMVRHPGDYQWSSYRAHAIGDANDWLVEHPVFAALGNTVERRRIAYRAICDEHLTDADLAVLRNVSRPPSPRAVIAELQPPALAL
ncbi:MAG TPA: transposase [Vicinamibacterales bacterium]|nr:transposase [Vicinamibacterales bacterium]